MSALITFHWHFPIVTLDEQPIVFCTFVCNAASPPHFPLPPSRISSHVGLLEEKVLKESVAGSASSVLAGTARGRSLITRHEWREGKFSIFRSGLFFLSFLHLCRNSSSFSSYAFHFSLWSFFPPFIRRHLRNFSFPFLKVFFHLFFFCCFVFCFRGTFFPSD